MTGGTGGKATTTTLFTRLTRGTTSAIIVVIQATSGQNAPRRGSRIAKGIIFTRMTAARGINPLKVLPMFMFALNPYLLLLFRIVG